MLLRMYHSKQGKYRLKVTLPDISDSSLKDPPAQLTSSANEMSETDNFTESQQHSKWCNSIAIAERENHSG